jgi:hypothetical protein
MTTVKRATIKSYNAATRRASVQIAGSLAVWLDGIPVASGIDGADVAAGTECGVVFFTDDNPNDACVVALYGVTDPAGHSRIRDADKDTRWEAEKNADEDKLRATIAGTERYLMQGSSLHHQLTGDVGITGFLRLDEQGLAPSGETDKVKLYTGSDLLHAVAFVGGASFDIIPGEKSGLQLAKGQHGMFTPDSSDTPTLAAHGLFANVAETFDTQSVTLDAQGKYLEYLSSNVSGNEVGLETGDIVRRDARFLATVRFRLTSLADIRFFMGFTDQSLSTMVSSDQPAGLYIGLQFVDSTASGRHDTTWRAVRKNGAGTFSNTNTNVTATTTDWRHYRALFGPTFPFQYVFDSDLISLLYGGNMTSPPVNTTPLKFVAGLEILANSIKGMQLAYGDITGFINS